MFDVEEDEKKTTFFGKMFPYSKLCLLNDVSNIAGIIHLHLITKTGQ